MAWTKPTEGPEAFEKPRGRPGKPRSPLTTDQQELAEKYLPFARKLVRKTADMYPRCAQDLFDASTLAVIQAAQSFDPSKGIKFSTFAAYRIKGAIKDCLRGQVLRGYRNDPDSQPEVWTADICEPDSEFIDNKGYNDPAKHWKSSMKALAMEDSSDHEMESVDFVERQLRKLPAKHQQVMRLLILEDKTQSQISQAIGCSKSRISWLVKDSGDRLRESLTLDDFL